MSESAVKFKSDLPNGVAEALAKAFDASRAVETMRKVGPLAETLAGVFCMAYRQSMDINSDATAAEVDGQTAVEAFLETLTR